MLGAAESRTAETRKMREDSGEARIIPRLYRVVLPGLSPPTASLVSRPQNELLTPRRSDRPKIAFVNRAKYGAWNHDRAGFAGNCLAYSGMVLVALIVERVNPAGISDERHG